VLSLSKQAWCPRPTLWQARGEGAIALILRSCRESGFSLTGVIRYGNNPAISGVTPDRLRTTFHAIRQSSDAANIQGRSQRMQMLANARNRQYMRDELRELLWLLSAASALSIGSAGLGVALALIFEGPSLWH